MEQAAERYARAWEDAERMREQELPVLEYQKRELQRGGRRRWKRRKPGATQDLQNAMRHEPQTFRAMKQLRGPERGAELGGAIRHEDRVRRDPNLQAERLVKEWKCLEKRHEKLSGQLSDRDARQKIENQMQGIAGKLKRDPQLESLMRARAKDLGIDMGSRLGRVIAGARHRAGHERQIVRGRGLSL